MKLNNDFQAEQKPNNEQLLIGLPSATDSTKPHVVRRIGCILVGHSWGGFDNNVCQKCNKKAIGFPKYNSPPPPPKRKPP